jgi:predicted small lipoprotein YifL
MKKTLLTMAAAGLLTLGLSSCGEKLLTPEQVEAEIAKGVEAGKASIDNEENAKCDAEFEARVSAEFDRLKMEYEAQQTIQ